MIGLLSFMVDLELNIILILYLLVLSGVQMPQIFLNSSSRSRVSPLLSDIELKCSYLNAQIDWALAGQGDNWEEQRSLPNNAPKKIPILSNHHSTTEMSKIYLS